MLLSTLTGNESFPNSSAKCHVFSSPTADTPWDGREIHIGAAVRENERGIRKVVSDVSHQIAPGYRDELGRWIKGVFQVPEGSVFKVFAYRNTSWNSRTVNANMFIQMREEAALRRLRVKLTQTDNATFHWAEIEGRFDELSLEQAKELGVKVLPQFAKFFDTTHTREVFETRILEPEITGRPIRRTSVVPTLDGEVIVESRRRTRSLDFD